MIPLVSCNSYGKMALAIIAQRNATPSESTKTMVCDGEHIKRGVVVEDQQIIAKLPNAGLPLPVQNRRRAVRLHLLRGRRNVALTDRKDGWG